MAEHHNEQRQATRDASGRYAKLPACPRCHKRKCLEPAYCKADGGTIDSGSPWCGLFICAACIKAESKP